MFLWCKSSELIISELMYRLNSKQHLEYDSYNLTRNLKPKSNPLADAHEFPQKQYRNYLEDNFSILGDNRLLASL